MCNSCLPIKDAFSDKNYFSQVVLVKMHKDKLFIDYIFSTEWCFIPQPTRKSQLRALESQKSQHTRTCVAKSQHTRTLVVRPGNVYHFMNFVLCFWTDQNTKKSVLGELRFYKLQLILSQNRLCLNMNYVLFGWPMVCWFVLKCIFKRWI